MSDGSEKNSKGTVLEVQGSYYKVKLEDGTPVPNAQNASSVDVIVGDKVIVSYVDSLHNPIITSVYDKTAGISKDELKEVLIKLKEDIQQELLERDHPVGSPYFTFLVDDDPNDRYPGTTWVLLDENTYLVSAGSNLVGMTPIGSNAHTLTTAQLPVHTPTFVTGGQAMVVSATTSHASMAVVNGYTSGANAGWFNNNNKNASSINSIGSGEAHNNMPKSIAIYMWRRTV